MPYKNKQKQKEYKRLWEASKRKERKLNNGTLEPNMEPKYVEPKPKRKMEPKSMEPKEPKSQLKDDPRINQILLKLEQQELERKLFHFEIREMVKEWKQSISEIKQTLSKLASKNQVPIVFYK